MLRRTFSASRFRTEVGYHPLQMAPHFGCGAICVGAVASVSLGNLPDSAEPTRERAPLLAYLTHTHGLLKETFIKTPVGHSATPKPFMCACCEQKAKSVDSTKLIPYFGVVRSYEHDDDCDFLDDSAGRNNGGWALWPDRVPAEGNKEVRHEDPGPLNPPVNLCLDAPARGPNAHAIDYFFTIADITQRTTRDAGTRAFWG